MTSLQNFYQSGSWPIRKQTASWLVGDSEYNQLVTGSTRHLTLMSWPVAGESGYGQNGDKSKRRQTETATGPK